MQTGLLRLDEMRATGVLCGSLLVFVGNHPQFFWKRVSCLAGSPAIIGLLLVGFSGVGLGAGMELSTGGGAEFFSMSLCTFLGTFTHQL